MFCEDVGDFQAWDNHNSNGSNSRSNNNNIIINNNSNDNDNNNNNNSNNNNNNNDNNNNNKNNNNNNNSRNNGNRHKWVHASACCVQPPGKPWKDGIGRPSFPWCLLGPRDLGGYSTAKKTRKGGSKKQAGASKEGKKIGRWFKKLGSCGVKKQDVGSLKQRVFLVNRKEGPIDTCSARTVKQKRSTVTSTDCGQDIDCATVCA